MKKFKLSVQDAMETVTDVRPSVCPNAGFMRQLEHFFDILNPELKQKKVEPVAAPSTSVESAKENEAVAPVAELAAVELAAEPEKEEPKEETQLQEVVEHKLVYSCRMCRKPLFLADDIMPHQVSQHNIAHHKRDKGNAVAADLVMCNSHFLQEPLKWMGNVDENEGKISCSKCQSRVGFWKWDGQQCSCGTWVTPAIQIAKNRVDERLSPVSTLVPS